MRTHSSKRRLHFQLIPRLPRWLHEGRRDVGRHASHVLALARHHKRAERVGERHDQAAMHRLVMFVSVEGRVSSNAESRRRTPTRFTLLVEE